MAVFLLDITFILNGTNFVLTGLQYIFQVEVYLLFQCFASISIVYKKILKFQGYKCKSNSMLQRIRWNKYINIIGISVDFG
jgi:hypothetical protein